MRQLNLKAYSYEIRTIIIRYVDDEATSQIVQNVHWNEMRGLSSRRRNIHVFNARRLRLHVGVGLKFKKKKKTKKKSNYAATSVASIRGEQMPIAASKHTLLFYLYPIILCLIHVSSQTKKKPKILNQRWNEEKKNT